MPEKMTDDAVLGATRAAAMACIAAGEAVSVLSLLRRGARGEEPRIKRALARLVADGEVPESALYASGGRRPAIGASTSGKVPTIDRMPVAYQPDGSPFRDDIRAAMARERSRGTRR